MTGKKVRSTLQTAGKLWIGWALTGTPGTPGSTTPNWAGFTRLRWRMVAYGYGARKMVGSGHSRVFTPTSSDGEIRAGYFSRGNSADGTYFIIIPPNLLNREVVHASHVKIKIPVFFSNKRKFLVGKVYHSLPVQ